MTSQVFQRVYIAGEGGQKSPAGRQPSPGHPVRRTRRRRPGRAKLPWFRCRNCQCRLAPMDIVDGRTCVRVNAYSVSFKIELTCEICGATREFVSMGCL